MLESPAGVAQLAEQPSCIGLNESNLTCDQAGITDEKWRAFAVTENCSDSCLSLVAAKTLHGKTATAARQILSCAGYEESTLSSYGRVPRFRHSPTPSAVFITAEYRRGLIRVSLTASAQRGPLLAAKAVVIGAVSFVTGLIAAIATIAVGERTLHAADVPLLPIPAPTLVRVIAGTAAMLAVAAALVLDPAAQRHGRRDRHRGDLHPVPARHRPERAPPERGRLAGPDHPCRRRLSAAGVPPVFAGHRQLQAGAYPGTPGSAARRRRDNKQTPHLKSGIGTIGNHIIASLLEEGSCLTLLVTSGTEAAPRRSSAAADTGVIMKLSPRSRSSRNAMRVATALTGAVALTATVTPAADANTAVPQPYKIWVRIGASDPYIQVCHTRA
jgi:hypothetical protein